MTAIVTSGRTDLSNLFTQSGVLDGELPHHPFLVFTTGDDGVTVHVVSSARQLVGTYAPEAPVMVQWAGRWRSDFFRMTVADVAAALEHRTREVACVVCLRSTLTRGWTTREVDGQTLRVCHGCRNTYDAAHPRTTR